MSNADDRHTRAAGLVTLTLVYCDGTLGERCILRGASVVVGGESGKLFARDPYISARHARFRRHPEGVLVEDLESMGNLFFRIQREEQLEDGDVLRIGYELLSLQLMPPAGHTIRTWGRLSLLTADDQQAAGYLLKGRLISIGRETGDIPFPDDARIAPLHATLSRGSDGRVALRDLASQSGTFLRLRRPRVLTFGSEILMGLQRFRLDKCD